MTTLNQLRSAVSGAVLAPGDPGYDDATSPRNTTARQHPALVVVPERAEDVAAGVRYARATGARVAVQATGHGAAGILEAPTILIETHRLAGIDIDGERRIARCGTGAVWGDITAAARSHGLAGLAGTSPTVGVAGYTFNGGWGWLTREHGLASARVRAVDYVDAEGAPRRAENDDVLWTFRGGGGIGVATAVEFELVPVGQLWAGFMLWPPELISDVLAAWSDALAGLPPTVTTMVSLLKAAPPLPTIPKATQGRPVTYLGLCATDLQAGRALSSALVRRLPEPLADTVAAIAATDLGAIHLDPPDAVPALGDGRFLDHLDTGHAQAILGAAEIGPEGPLNAVELRHTAEGHPPADAGDGALTTSPAPFLLHATGSAPDPAARTATETQLQAVRHAAAPVDAGLGPHSFRDGRTDTPDALAPDDLSRLAQLHTTHDPDATFAAARTHSPPHDQ